LENFNFNYNLKQKYILKLIKNACNYKLIIKRLKNINNIKTYKIHFSIVPKESTKYILNMNLSLILFLIGILGFILNRKNIILMIISIEIMLLAVTLLILISSFNFDDNLGQTFGIYIIAMAGAESVIGLSILVAYYRLNNSLLSNYLSYSNKPFVKFVNKIPNISIKAKRRNYSTINKIQSIDPWFITGIFDAEQTKAITIWGTNLTSTVGITYTLKQLTMVQLAPYQHSVIIGLMLSDGWIIYASKNSKIHD
jgi:NADH-ubiquinone oxidoreductase chain 4L